MNVSSAEKFYYQFFDQQQSRSIWLVANMVKISAPAKSSIETKFKLNTSIIGL